MKKLIDLAKSILANIFAGIPYAMMFIVAITIINIIMIFFTGDFYEDRFNRIDERLIIVEKRVDDVYAIIGDDGAFQDDVYENFLALNQKIDKIVAETKPPRLKKNNSPCHQ